MSSLPPSAMDRPAMRWLARKPGRTVDERAGAGQRILATVRRETFDTLENSVAHACAGLAADVAREWLLAHRKAQGSARYRRIDAFRSACRAIARHLDDLGIGVERPPLRSAFARGPDRPRAAGGGAIGAAPAVRFLQVGRGS